MAHRIVIVGGGAAGLVLATGLPRFEVVVGEPRGATELERVTDIAGTPVIFENDVCAVSYQGRVACFDALTGAPHWSKPTSSDKGVAVGDVMARVTRVAPAREVSSGSGRARPARW